MTGVFFVVACLAAQEPDLDPWLEKLRSGTIEEREEASRHLRKHGKGSIDRLRKALRDSDDPEFQTRLCEILKSLTTVQLDLVKTISFQANRPERIVWRPDGKQVAIGGGRGEGDRRLRHRILGAGTSAGDAGPPLRLRLQSLVQSVRGPDQGGD